MVDTVVAAKVDPETKANLIKAAASNGKNINEVLKELVNGYLDDHDKLTHLKQTEPSKEAEKLELVIPTEVEKIELDGDEEMSADEFYTEIQDSFREWEKERGYSYIKTSDLRSLVAALKLKTKKKAETYDCPKCGHKEDAPFKKCPECGSKLKWD